MLLEALRPHRNASNRSNRLQFPGGLNKNKGLGLGASTIPCVGLPRGYVPMRCEGLVAGPKKEGSVYEAIFPQVNSGGNSGEKRAPIRADTAADSLQINEMSRNTA